MSDKIPLPWDSAQCNITIWSNVTKLHSHLDTTWFNHASRVLSYDVIMLIIFGCWLQRSKSYMQRRKPNNTNDGEKKDKTLIFAHSKHKRVQLDLPFVSIHRTVRLGKSLKSISHHSHVLCWNHSWSMKYCQHKRWFELL